jgi:rhodanese-related sulfurtransferase
MTHGIYLWLVTALALGVLACGGPAQRRATPAATRVVVGESRPARATSHTSAPKPGVISHIQLDRFFTLQQSGGALVYDVRPAFSYLIGHIPNALSWPKSKFAGQLAVREVEMRAATAGKRPVVFYCTDSACPDSTIVATRLAALGHCVTILDDGYHAWKSSELPTE